MPLPLPYKVTEPVDAESVQANLDELAKQFPISRKDVKIESPHKVGAAGEPPFSGAWVDFDTTTFHGARFWKDPMGMVHMQGLVKSGVIGTTIFTLPAGYRPSNGLLLATISNGAIGRLDIAPTGNVVATSGNNTYFSIDAHFKGEQ